MGRLRRPCSMTQVQSPGMGSCSHQYATQFAFVRSLHHMRRLGYRRGSIYARRSMQAPLTSARKWQAYMKQVVNVAAHLYDMDQLKLSLVRTCFPSSKRNCTHGFCGSSAPSHSTSSASSGAACAAANGCGVLPVAALVDFFSRYVALSRSPIATLRDCTVPSTSCSPGSSI